MFGLLNKRGGREGETGEIRGVVVEEGGTTCDSRYEVTGRGGERNRVVVRFERRKGLGMHRT